MEKKKKKKEAVLKESNRRTEKERIKESIDAIIKDDSPIKTSLQFAEAYLKGITTGTPKEVPPAVRMTSVYRFPSKVTKELQAVRDKIIGDQRKDFLEKLSIETQSLLKKNYLNAPKAMIIDALIDFLPCVGFSAVTSRSGLCKEIFKPRASLKRWEEGIESCRTLEKLALSDNERSTIEGIRKECETFINNIQEIDSTPMKEFELLSLPLKLFPLSSILLLQPGNNPIKGIDETLEAFIFLNIKRPQGRPKDFFFKALQICIYIILTKDNQKKELAKRLTAAIINECYIDLDILPTLTAKDVDNALHSS